jgi:hypothetical protein
VRGSDTLKPAITEEFAYDGAILLFDPGLVILSIRARPRELDAVAEAVLDHCLVHKFTAIVDI